MAAEAPPPLFPNRIDLHKVIYHKGVAIEFKERSEVPAFPRGKQYILGYVLRDTSAKPTFESPLAHLFIQEMQDVRPEIDKVVEMYKRIKEALTP